MFSASGDRKYHSSTGFLSTARTGTPFRQQVANELATDKAAGPSYQRQLRHYSSPLLQSDPEGLNRIRRSAVSIFVPRAAFFEVTGRRSCNGSRASFVRDARARRGVALLWKSRETSHDGTVDLYRGRAQHQASRRSKIIGTVDRAMFGILRSRSAAANISTRSNSANILSSRISRDSRSSLAGRGSACSRSAAELGPPR